jgi:transposase
MERRSKHYSREFKIKAVELSNERGTVAQVAKELDISYENLKRWKKEYKAGKYHQEPGAVKSNPVDEELKQLRKELYETKLERDILKKAVGIFSKSDR